MENKTFEQILSMVVDACNKSFTDGDFNKKTVILGKTVFLTKDEAKQVLSKMKGGAE
ncbi:MAG: hypothetical protein J6L83_05570 [Clostridia bacterium]|nr:hypothetical protein [Clostridia bacterium]